MNPVCFHWVLVREKTVEGKSNLMSEDGKNWYPASYVGFAESNFNVAVHLTPDEVIRRNVLPVSVWCATDKT